MSLKKALKKTYSKKKNQCTAHRNLVSFLPGLKYFYFSTGFGIGLHFEAHSDLQVELITYAMININ